MEIKEVLDELRKQKKDGNIVFLTWDGFKASPLEDFITQPADGILYDLNRLEEVTTTLAEADKIDKRWVNDYAVATIIRFLYKEMSALKAERDRLREALEHSLQGNEEMLKLLMEHPVLRGHADKCAVIFENINIATKALESE